MIRFAFGVLLTLGILVGNAAHATPRYIMTVYGWNGSPNLPKWSHSYATFEKDEDGRRELHTISWLPTDGKVPPFGQVTGHNFSLEESQELGVSYTTVKFGPFNIKEALYNRALSRIDFLESGGTNYIMIDTFTRKLALTDQPGGAVNCIHAISDLGGYLDTGASYGASASLKIVNWLEPYIIHDN